MAITSTEQEVLTLLRRALSDTTPNQVAFTLHLEDESASEASVEVVHGFLRVAVTNGVQADDLDIPLSDVRVETVRDLMDYINAQRGFSAEPALDANYEHPSVDLHVQPLVNLRTDGVQFKHRRFSDSELMGYLKSGVERHNMSYTVATVPVREHGYVVTLAHAIACRQMATNAAKRQGLDATPSDLIALADSLDRQYRDDRKRQERAIPVPEIHDDSVGEGDVVQGELYRRSGRTGFNSPMSANLPPEPPVLFEPDDLDVQDTIIRLRWARARDYDFYAAELWRDTQENVRRYRSGVFSRTPTASRDLQDPTTSKLVFQTFGGNSNFDTVSFATFLEEFGQLITSFTDGLEVPDTNYDVRPLPIEPDTVYYYRLYFVDLNYEIKDSFAIRVRTKTLRARFAENNPFDIIAGPMAGGTTVTATGERFTEGMTVFIGDKEVANLTVNSSTEITFDTPTYLNSQVLNKPQDIVLTSRNGLQEIIQGQWTYTS